MATDTVKFIMKKIGKGAGTVLLALSSAGFAAYALRHFPFWGFALAFLLMVGAFVPMILFFNLFLSPGKPGPEGYQFPSKKDRDRCNLFPSHRDNDLFDD